MTLLSTMIFGYRFDICNIIILHGYIYMGFPISEIYEFPHLRSAAAMFEFMYTHTSNASLIVGE